MLALSLKTCSLLDFEHALSQVVVVLDGDDSADAAESNGILTSIQHRPSDGHVVAIGR